MTTDQVIVFVILGGALVLFAWGRWRYDLVAAAALLATVFAGLVSPTAAFAGFGHPAVITVGAVLIISHALKQSGLVNLIAAQLAPLTVYTIPHILALTVVVTVASAFMNNVGALALMLPVAMATAAERERSPAILLMPLAFGSILGGMTTMIGTPPNIIVATYRSNVADAPFAMFDFSPVGLPVALLGVLFVAIVGWHLIPQARRNRNAPQQLFQIDDYLIELRVADESPLIGEEVADIEGFNADDVDVIGRARGLGRPMALAHNHVLRAGDILIVRGDPEVLKPLIEASGLELLTSDTKASEDLTREGLSLFEGVVTAGSALEGRDVLYLRRRSSNAAALVALARHGVPVRRRLRQQIFETGDVLLLQGETETMPETLSHLGLLPLAGRELTIGETRRVGLGFLIFAAAIALGASGLISMTVAFVAAVLVYVVTGLLPVKELYREVDWPVITLLAAMIPVGGALESTGATTLVADLIVSATAGLPIVVVLGLVLVVTMFLSDVINNAATALVMAPISVGIAHTLGVNTDPFLMAVAVGASCAFLTPIGHQSNTLVMGPGGYEFTDYWRMGLPLEILIVAVSVPCILWVWPL